MGYCCWGAACGVDAYAYAWAGYADSYAYPNTHAHTNSYAYPNTHAHTNSHPDANPGPTTGWYNGYCC